MTEVFQALFLGIIQGLTELLPISSSAHLDILPWIFGWTNSEAFNIAFEGFDVALHFEHCLQLGYTFLKIGLNL